MLETKERRKVFQKWHQNYSTFKNYTTQSKTRNIFWLVSSSSVPFFGLIQYIPCNAFISPLGESRQVHVVVCECEGLAPPRGSVEQLTTQTMLREPLELRLRVRGMVWWRGMGESGGQNWWGWL